MFVGRARSQVEGVREDEVESGPGSGKANVNEESGDRDGERSIGGRKLISRRAGSEVSYSTELGACGNRGYFSVVFRDESSRSSVGM